MKPSKELKKWIIKNLPIDNEWHTTSYESFIKASETMLENGMSDEEIKKVLKKCYYACCNEFGL